MQRSFITAAIMLMVGCVMPGCETSDVTLVGVRDFNLSSPRTGFTTVASLDAGDMIELSVEVDGNSEVPLYEASVNHLGYVTLPLIGDVQVGGMKLDAARKKIAERYETYYVTKPVIMVALAGADSGAWGQVLVTGRGVDNPGPVPLPSSSGMRLSAAIQAAGGFAPSANTSKIQITRIDSRGRRLRVVVDFDDIGSGGDAEADVLLRAGDIVNVTERIW